MGFDKLVEIKAVIFDLDGVLTNTSEYHYRAWKRLADEEGIPFTRADNERLRGVSRQRSLELLLGSREVSEEQAQEMMARKNRYYQELIQQVTPDDVLPGVLELLLECQQAGVKVAIGSASKNTRTVVERMGIGHLVDAIADGYSVTRQKPAPDLFLRAAEMLDVSPANCVVVEDAASGIEAARAAGMWTVGLGPVERVGAADLVFPDLAGVTLTDIRFNLQPTMNDWHIIETEFNPQALHHKETVFTIGNGYLGTRGTFEEGYPGAQPATLIHGVYDDAPIGFSELTNAPDWLPFALLVEGERFNMDRGEVLAYQRTLDLRRGLLRREVRWRSPTGRTVELAIERFASLADPHLLAIRYRVTPLDFDCWVELRAGINGHVDNNGQVHWEWVDQGGEGGQVWLQARTRGSGIELCQATTLLVDGAQQVQETIWDCQGCPTLVVRRRVRRGHPVTTDKLVAVFTSPPSVPPGRGEERGVGAAARAKVQQAAGLGYEALRAAHEAEWEQTWAACDVVIEGDDEAQRAVRYNLFQLLIAAPRGDERVSTPAKTLSGFGYRGHIFWDTEIFMLPFFTFTQPAVARSLLMFRYHTLAGARAKAREAGYEGAMYPWESVPSGAEATPRWVPRPNGEVVRIWCGDQEHHISADVAYAVWQYWQATGDDAFMADYGAEMVLDTAVFWGSRVEWNPRRGYYEINQVMGPDENHDHVDDNAFTNGMARWHLKTALETLAWLWRYHPQKAAGLEARLDLTPERLAHWADVIGCLYIPHDLESGLMEQFDGFFDLEEVDWAGLEPRTRSIQALLGIERTRQVKALKQPDVLMLLYVLRGEYDEKTKRANWDYYVPRTDETYGSSLGPAVHALLACELGMPDVAYQHFMRAALVDLEDVRGNTAEGIHGGSAGGVWQAVVFGFAGLKVREKGWSTEPRLPSHWRRLAFHFTRRGELVKVNLTPATK